MVCPACRIMLRLPGDDALPGPLLLEREGAVHDERLSGDLDESAGGRIGAGPLAGLVVIAVSALGLFAWWLMPDSGAGKSSAPLVESESAPAALEAEAEEETPREAPKSGIGEVDSVAKEFLNASSMDELERWIRLPEATMPKVRAWYAEEPYSPAGFNSLAGDYTFSTQEGVEWVAVPVRTADFEKRNLILVKEPAGWRVDWESWVGWSEISWPGFRSSKPIEPKLFRVKVSEVDYYNFGFKDELKWRSYRLDSPDGEQSLFGYVERGSDTDVRLDPRDAVNGKPMLLTLKFPPDAPSDNQVLIDRIVAEDWLDLSSPPPP